MSAVIDLTGDGRDDLWTEVIALGGQVQDWALVGGLMVTLWAHHAGVTMGRTTTDIDAMLRADALTGQPRAVTERLLSRGYELAPSQPVDMGERSLAFRFQRDSVTIDLLVPSKAARARRRPVTLPPSEAVAVAGGSYALAHVVDVTVRCGSQEGQVPVTSPLGGLLIKAKALAHDQDPGRARHAHDLAVLWACLEEPAVVELPRGQRAALRNAARLAEWSVITDADVRARARAAARLAVGG